MKDKLAEKLLNEVTGIESPREQAVIREDLQVLSRTKYDDYGGYTPGVKFMESLAMWLNGFEEEDREEALTFIRERLTYVSAAELDHLVSTVYQDNIRPRLIDLTAKELGMPKWRVRAIVDSPQFRSRQRRMLILGMSDGARLDTLRRSSSLSTEQFHLDYVLADSKAKSMKKKLKEALSKDGLPGEATFSSVVVVDDFSGSGASMLRWDDVENEWGGKIMKINKEVDRLQERGVVEADARVTALLYLITPAARQTLTTLIAEADLSDRFSLVWGHEFSDALRLTPERDPGFWMLCEKYFRESWKDEHNTVGGDPTFGFGASALPLVIHHNAPNNAPPIIWKDDPDARSEEGGPWFGVFPRHERHHKDRA